MTYFHFDSKEAMQQYQQVRRPLLGLLALFIITVGLIIGLREPDIALAQTSSCGEPLRTITADPDRDGMVDRMFDLEECYIQTFDYDGTEKKIVIYYTTANGSAADRLNSIDTDGDGTDDLTARQVATRVADWTEEAWEAYLDYGFGDPLGRNSMDVQVFDMRPGLLGWCCGSSHYNTDAPAILRSLRNDPRNAAATSYHEMWHAAEFSGKGAWIDEGTASNMGDHVTIPVDLDDSNDYIGRVNGYLNWGTDRSLTTQAYTAALWWTYFMEQVGTRTSEPDRGVDAMFDFWDNLGSGGLPTLDSLIRGAPGGRTLESLWIDFTVANYNKELTGASLPAKYVYQDELQSGAPDYPAVNPTINEALGMGDSIIDTTNIEAWAAHYYQVQPDSDVPIIDIEFRQDTARSLGYTLLLIRDNSIISQENHRGRDFTRSVANNDYDRVVVIVTSLNEFANFRYSINGTEPVLNILDPLTGREALAGDPNSPDKILIKVEVLTPLGGGTPVAGIDPNTFQITVGSETISNTTDSRRISSAYVQGQYWLLIRAPQQTSTGDYDLTVAHNTLTDTEFRAVNYMTATDKDSVLIIDRSGSMADANKLESAQDSARLYVDSWNSGDKIGVVSYDDDARVDLSLRDWSPTSRTQAFTQINALSPGTTTSIGGGLIEGLDELKARGDTDHVWSLVLLTDGLHNEPPPISDFINEYETRKDNGSKVPMVHTVALGPDADRVAMEELANDTGGAYHYAALPGGSITDAPLTAAAVANLTNELAGVYRVVSEAVAQQQQIYFAGADIAFQDSTTHAIPVDSGAGEAVFVLKWDFGNLSADIDLRRPDGTFIEPTLVDDLHLVWQVPNPAAGDWELTVASDCLEFCAEEYIVEAALKSDLTMEVFLGLAVDERLVGRPMPILVSLSDTQPLTGAAVNAQITGPDGTVWELTLHDDGAHDDGAAGDGFYGNTFYQTAVEGSYVAVVTAQGTSTLGQDFQRRLRASFNMADAEDADQDGLPDWWEEEYGTDIQTNDANSDPDQDDLINIVEFGEGTNPTDSDTDDGGQNDGSEVAQGTDPQEAGDDQIACILDFQARTVIAQPEELLPVDGVVLDFTVAPEHESFVLWRATGPDGPWQILDQAIDPTGIYTDTQVTMGTTYHYRLQAVDQAGRESCVLGPRSATPKEDPVPPMGYVLINEGAQTTDSAEATLMLEASTDTEEMIVSNQPDFSDATWEPYQTTKSWTLEFENGSATVFVMFRDGAGNESDPVNDSIRRPEEANIWLPFIIKE